MPHHATWICSSRLHGRCQFSSAEPSNQPKADDEALKVSYNSSNNQRPTTNNQQQGDIGLGL
uniref:GG12547 n=1 Tax=Drosophila erecta TaxID=7220 RepID=B3P8Q2_DROER